MILKFSFSNDLIIREAEPSWNKIIVDENWHKKFLERCGLIGFIIGICIILICMFFIFSDFNDWMQSLFISETTQFSNIFVLIGKYVLSIILILFVHEFLHIVCWPKFGLNNDTIFIILIKQMICLGIFRNYINRNRMLFSLLAPTLILTILPLCYAIYHPFPPLYLMLPIIINSFGIGGDILSAYVIIKNVPFNATLINCKDGMYWYK